MSEAWSCKDSPRHGVVRTREKHQHSRKILDNERCTFVSILTKRRNETYIDAAGISTVASRSEEFTQTLYYKPFKMKPLYSFSNFQETLQQTCTLQCSFFVQEVSVVHINLQKSAKS